MEKPAQSFGGRMDGVLSDYVGRICWSEPGVDRHLVVPKPHIIPQRALDESAARLGAEVHVDQSFYSTIYRWKRIGAEA
jgi:hypothetical protein